MTDLLKHFPKPLLDDVVRGRCRPGDRRVVLVRDTGTAAPADLAQQRFLVRPTATGESFDQFVEALDKVLAELATQLGGKLLEEPERLYKAREYNAAILAAFSSLEAELRRVVGEPSDRSPIRRLVEVGNRQGLLSPSDASSVTESMRLRNGLLHEGLRATSADAKRVIGQLLPIVRRLRSESPRSDGADPSPKRRTVP